MNRRQALLALLAGPVSAPHSAGALRPPHPPEHGASARRTSPPRAVARPEGTRLRVAAAADLRFAMDPLARVFRQARPGAGVEPIFGSSGSFFAQIGSGAPFDVFLSADADYPRRLVASGLSRDGTHFLYAVGRLAVWARSGSPADPAALGMKALLHPSVRRVAIANPAHAPYGRAAVAALKSLGVHEAVKDRLALGENVAQAAQFVESGAAEVGVIALSLAQAPALKGGRLWNVPADAHPRLEQAGVILRAARDPELAAAFRDFLLSPAGRGVLSSFGFDLPESVAATSPRGAPPRP